MVTLATYPTDWRVQHRWRPDSGCISQSLGWHVAHTCLGALLDFPKQNCRIYTFKTSPDDFLTTGRLLTNGIRWLLARVVTERERSIQGVVGLGDQGFSVLLVIFPATVDLWDCIQLVCTPLQVLSRFLILAMGLWRLQSANVISWLMFGELFPRWHRVDNQTLDWVSTFCWKNKVKKMAFQFFPTRTFSFFLLCLCTLLWLTVLLVSAIIACM